MSRFLSKARTGIDFYRSPLHGALGFMPEYSEHARANPIEIVCGVRQLTDEEIEREAAWLRETRDELFSEELEEHAVLTHRQAIHEKFEQVQVMKRRLREIEAELSAKKEASE
ncbi:hypothetical protein OAD67_00605 [bacterium]|jgi:hypothetical protein|nr:hypothetical protein [bacterium]|tara:strand:- start:24500 stop:24838 length:339 start_codon:yes stop_codon:yes gene_type:complete